MTPISASNDEAAPGKPADHHPNPPQLPSLAYQRLVLDAPLSDSQSEGAYSASIPDSPPPPLLPVSFERDDKPFRHKSVPRHSPLVRSTTKPLPTPPQSAYVVVSKTSNHSVYDAYDPQRLSMTASLTDSATSTEKSTMADQATSFLYGFVMGILPPLIVVRAILAICFPVLDAPGTLNHRHYVYGRSLGMLALVTIIIVVVVIVIKLR